MRTRIAAANWKMNLDLTSAEKLLDDLKPALTGLSASRTALFAVPFPYLMTAVAKLQGVAHVSVAAQNCSNKMGGAYTGEVSITMLQSIGVKHVLVGHSERRELFHEDNALLQEKITLLIEHGMQPLFCCGEPLSVREKNGQETWVQQQLEESLFHLSAEQLANVIIAYEPIWAIGTGRTASAGQAEEMHSFIRSAISSSYGSSVASSVTILYGGSVKASNASELFSQPDVDGGLVGGASLDAKEFAGIVSAL